jgi:glutathione S-transferase
MKLYYMPGACSMGSHIILRETEGAFALERVDIATKRTETGRDFREVNPRGAVPALETDAGDVVTEGPAILQFIAESRGGEGLVGPSGTIRRARVQEMLNFISSELNPAFGPLFNPTLAPEVRAGLVANVERKIDWLESVLADGRAWLTGANYTVADAYGFAVLGFTRMHKIPLDGWPRVAAFMGRMMERPAVRASMQAEGLAA